MKNILLSVLLSAIVAVFAQTAFSQGFPYETYQTRTLSEMVEMDSGIEKTANILIQKKPFYSAIRVKYKGKSRAISPARMELFKQWQESLKVDSKVLTLLKDEYLFEECNQEYWIPVQKQVAAFFPKELKTGDRITLYLMAVGGIKTGKDWKPVFLTNEFKKY